GRQPLRFRIAVVAKSSDELIQELCRYRMGQKSRVYSNVLDESVGIHSCGDSGVEIQYQNDDVAIAVPKTIVKAWLKGSWGNWSSLYNGAIPQKIALPVYAFNAESHWLKSETFRQSENTDSFSKVNVVDANSSVIRSVDSKLSSSVKSNPVTDTVESSLKNRVSSALSSSREAPAISDFIVDVASKTLGISKEKIDTARALEQYGMDSIMLIQALNHLRKRFPSLDAMALSNYRSVDALCDYISSEYDAIKINDEADTSDDVRVNNVDSSGDIVNVSKVSADVKLEYTAVVSKDDADKRELSSLAERIRSGKLDFRDAIDALEDKHGEII
ncbi:MAG: acyl carrier protein, partial [Flavobacteriales bacterium]